MRRLFWIILVGTKCHHMYPYKRKAEGIRYTDHRGEGNVKTEAETGVMQPQVKECQQPSEAGRSKQQILP